MVDPIVAWVARLALAGVFAAAALHKWRDLRAFAAALAAHRLVPEALVPALARAFAAAETAVAAALLVPASAASAGCAARRAARALLGRDRDQPRARPARDRLRLLGAPATALARAARAQRGARRGRASRGAARDAAARWSGSTRSRAAAGAAALAFVWLAAQSLAFGAPACARLGRST